MPLPPYQYRPITPPTHEVPGLIQGGHNRNLSGGSSWSADSSPDSIDIHISTPLDRSPLRQHGPQLLPKIRTQDRSLDPSCFVDKSHRRALSNTFNPPGQAPVRPTRPVIERAVTVPPECGSLISPVSATSTNFSVFSPAGVNSQASSPINVTPSYLQKSFKHSRSISTPSIDNEALSRYGYPTYRRVPSYVAGAYWSPSVTPGSSVFNPPTVAPRVQNVVFDLPEEQRFTQPDEQTTTTSEFLRGANPAVDLVQKVNCVIGRGMHSHFWWDIRNLRVWDTFNLNTIMETPFMEQLLNVDVNLSAFPKLDIQSRQLHPESERDLVELIRDFYMTKVNAAIKITQGAQRHMTMSIGKDRDGPSFISTYQDDYEKTISGNGRGRIVGIVRSYERWNSGMRSEAGQKKVYYLEGLSALHKHMRDHQCRYGFIMTETELVCVRAGTEETPYFGFLELAAVIETRSREGLTAPLALWWLHMLAKEEPLPGQCSWKLNVGAPAAMTRQHVLAEKDKWIPEPQMGEKREAKRVRGWVLPSDPWNKKREGPRGVKA